MKKYFTLTLEGKDWWKPFLLYWVVYVAYFVVTQVIARRGSAGAPLAFFLVTLVAMLVYLAAFAIFFIVAARIIAPTAKIGDTDFGFTGSIGKYLGIVIGGTLLSIVTLGIYLPWFSRWQISYLASETRIAGEKPEFRGKPSRLLLIVLPFILCVVAAAVGSALLGLSRGGYSPSARAAASSGTMAMTLVTFFVVFLICVPFVYLVYRWVVNFSCSGATLRWKTKFWPSIGILFGQIALTIVTLGIYWPVAMLRLFGYFAERTILEREGREVGALGFEGKISKGFLLLWGQTLLSIITLGVYLPWAIPKMWRWILGATYAELEVAES